MIMIVLIFFIKILIMIITSNLYRAIQDGFKALFKTSINYMKTSRSNKKYKKKVQYMKTKYNIKISNVEKQKEISEIQI